MLQIKQISDFELENKNIIIREDLNVPLKNGKITSFERRDACIPSIKKILNQGANVSILSHLGRPIVAIILVCRYVWVFTSVISYFFNNFRTGKSSFSIKFKKAPPPVET